MVLRLRIIFCLLIVSGPLLAQKPAVTMPVDFQDSLRIVLEKTRNLDATVAGAAFVAAWPSLTPDQQNQIKRQVYQLRRKKVPLRPAITNYAAAIGHAIQIEKADAATVSSFLKVAGKVIENEKGSSLNGFFQHARVFFQRHALHYEKPFRLHISGGTYAFDYIAPPPAYDPYDTTQVVETTETTGEESLPEPMEDTLSMETALYLNPPPPPSQEGPVIRFTNITLNFVTAYDSIFLANTRGTFSMRDGLWVGEGGTFDWSSAGVPPDTVVCNMTTYFFNTARPEITAPLVKLQYLGKTPGFVPGTFEYKSQPRRDSVKSSYPRFKSYQADLKLQDIGDESVKFTGGFTLIGSKISSANVAGDYSTLEVYHDGLRKMVSRSVDFTFQDSLISASRSFTTLYQRNDSVSHPSIGMKYRYGRDSLRLISLRTERGNMRHTPFSSSFFGVDFSADVIDWNLYSDSLNLRVEGGRNDVPMIIESIDYYDREDYRLLAGVDFRFSPIALIANYCIKNKTREFYSGDLVSTSKLEVAEVKRAIDFLATKGYLTYNPNADLVKVKDKLVALYKASKGDRDYDNMKIHSVIDSFPNATLNLDKGYMTVRGVEEFNLSDSLNVKIIPDSSVITLLRNRDIKFDGTVTAGNFEISGKGFTLRYDSFYINLNKIDSINFFTIEKTANGQVQRKKIPNSMVGADSTAASAGGLGNIKSSSGTLFISKANNKSGRKKIPNYPRLDATTGGAIYFDREEVLGGVYDRSMFFVVPPFKLDSLNDADPTSINFDGTFVSSGMFPSFKEKLHTMPDKSLGFEHSTPATGWKMYNGDGKYSGVLRLDHQGLRGKGEINYLAATLDADDFVFYPDSVIGKGAKARIEPKQFGNVNFPQADLLNYDMKWYPKDDKMRLKNTREAFQFYNNTAQMQGTLTISKGGVNGMGKLETRGTELISRNMTFNTNDFSARHGRFKVKSDDPAKPLMTGTDVRMRFNLEKNYADISPEIEGDAAIDFPFAQIKTSIPNMRWDLNTQKIVMTKAKDVPIENSYFYSTRPELDSLVFNADKAEYDIKKQELKVSGIPYIVVADAKITPENNEVLILENSKIGTLKNTVIILDTLNAYHRLTDGVVDIKSRKEFSGYATYQYVNFLKDTFAIKMTDFHLDQITTEEMSRKSSRRKNPVATLQTVAVGNVTDKDNMVLGAGMFYKGDITMYATRPALQLKGFVKLDIKRIKNYNTWIQYEQTGEETEVLIDFASALNEESRKVDAGLHLESGKNDLYISFLSDKRNDDDDDIFIPEGKLYYDTATSEFKIEDVGKARGEKLSGKVFAYQDKTLQVKFEGPVTIFNGSKDFNVNSTAIGEGSLETNEIKMNTLMVVESNVPPAAFELMAKQLLDVVKNEGADEGLGDQTELLYKIADILGEKAVRDYEKKTLQGYVSLATLPEFFKPLVISNVNMKWSAKSKSFYNEGKIGISNILKNDINAAFEGFLEITRAEDGSSIFRLFFKASPEAWYYIDFENNRVMVHSSNQDFNSIITKKTNVAKVKLGEIAFIPGSDDETLQFINRFRKTYYGIDVPYSLNEAAAGAAKKKEEKKETEDGF